MTFLDAVLFGYAGLCAAWLAYLLLAEGLQPNWQALLLVVFWVLVAYLVLPRLHRVLTYLYVPNYFIGRTRTSDGLLGDPVNLAFRGSEAQLHGVLTAAGWTRADEVTLASSWRIVRDTLTRRPYAQAPVSPLFLFERRQDFAYQQEVAGNPAQRHHVRFWRCPPGWRLPGGYAVDWVAAGTYDRSVGLSLMTLQVTHRIAADIDVERDHVVASLTGADPAVRVDRIDHFATGYHARNGGGDAMITDGDLPVVDLRGAQAADAWRRVPTSDSRDRRPGAIAFSAVVTWVRALVVGVVALLVLLDPSSTRDLLGSGVGTATLASAVALFGMAAFDVWLGVATYTGRNWARVLLMLASATTVTLAFLAAAKGGPRPVLDTTLPHIALGILVLLALTTPAARAYATRPRAVPA
jgi:hypothetical protein